MKKEEIINENEEETVETVEDKNQECATEEETETNSENLEENEQIDELKDLREKFMFFKDKNKKMENELEAYKERLLRLSAEYENYRKRTEKEKERIYTDACEDVLVKMLPVLDNLERAIAVEGAPIEALKTGIDMTIKQFQDSLQKLGVEEIETSEGFDPNLHQAVMHVEDESLEKNVVAEVFQKGYKKGDKVLRFTMVKVAN